MSDPHDREPVDQATIDCWRINYGLDKRTPAQAAQWWGDNLRGLAPSGAVAALGVALDEIDALRDDAGRYRKMRSADMPTRNRLEHYSGAALDLMLDDMPAAG